MQSAPTGAWHPGRTDLPLLPMPAEILAEALRAMGQSVPWLLSATVAALALLGLERRRPAQAVAGAIVLSVGLGLGLAFAWRILWIADDAFISFRYARNFARGLGLVYNEGEWVEGYTNFLWTLLLGLAGKLGLDIPLTALFGNLAAFAATVLLAALLPARLAPKHAVVPFAAIALALAKPFYTFAGSGLETMPIALLGLSAMALSLRPRGELWAGCALTAAVLCRPDQILLFAAMGIALAAEDLAFGAGPPARRLRPGRLLAYAAPFLLVYVPYFAWRWSAYGAPFPNTFYAKSADAAYWSQGLVYLTHFVSTSGAWLWLPLFLVSLFVRSAAREVFRLRVYAVLSVLFLGGYVVRVGGDFMEYRFFVPLLPLVAVCTELGLRQRPLVGARGVAIAMSTALALGFSWTPLRLIRPFEIRWHLAAEETFYQVRSLAPLRIANGHFDAGVRLHEALTRRGIRPKIVGGAIGMLGYFSDLPLFDVMGLTSKVGRKAIAMRDRPGHEKRATVEEILEAGVLVDLWPLHGPRWRDATRVELDGVRFHLVRFDPELVEALAAVPGARLPDPLRDVDALLRGATRSELLEAVRFYSVFLADWPRRDEVLGPLRARLAAVEDFEEEHDLPPPFRVVRWRFPEGKSGLGHSSTLGMEGRGELRIPLQIVARELRLVLGGPASDRLGVKLLVDGEVRTAVHPAGGPGLDPVVVDTAAWIGRPGELRIFDLDPRAEVGVEVDAIHFAPAGADLADRLDAGEPLGPLLWEAERSLPAGHPVRARIEARVAERHRFDDGLPAGTTVEGEAFGEGPAPGALPWQAPLVGQRGAGLLNSYHGGDASRGKVILPERVLDGSPIHLLVGGGFDCDQVYAGLEVEGRVVQRVCGAGDEVLRPARLDTAPYAGARGRLVVVDEAEGPWGHVLVDEVVIERAP